MTENTTETEARTEVTRVPASPLTQEEVEIVQQFVDTMRQLPLWPQRAVMAGHEVLMLVTIIHDEEGTAQAAPIAIMPDFWMFEEPGFLAQGDGSLPVEDGATEAEAEWMQQNYNPQAESLQDVMQALFQQAALTGNYDATDPAFAAVEIDETPQEG